MIIERSAAQAAALFNDPIGDDMADLMTTPEEWRRVEDDPLELVVEGVGVKRPQVEWIRERLAGFLVMDGNVVPCRS